jgi:hypothetical protein
MEFFCYHRDRPGSVATAHNLGWDDVLAIASRKRAGRGPSITRSFLNTLIKGICR